MSPIEKLCQKINNTFFEATKKEVLAAVLMLGNAYLLLEKENLKAPDRELLESTLQSVKAKLKEDAVHRLWDEIKTCSSSSRAKNFTAENKMAFEALQSAMLRDPVYFKSISVKDLTDFVIKRVWPDEALIAILRKHLHTKKCEDPFLDNFSYKTLSETGDEYKCHYLYPFLDKMDSLPIETILTLAQDPLIAASLLKDFSLSYAFFEVSYHLALAYPLLCPSLASMWEDKFKTYPFSTEQKAACLEKLTLLKKKDSTAFSQVNIDGYVQRANAMGSNYPPNHFLRTIWITASTITTVLASSAMIFWRGITTLTPIASRFVATRCVDGICLSAAASATSGGGGIAAVAGSPLGGLAYSAISVAAPVFMPAACLAGVGYMVLPYGKKAIELAQAYRNKCSLKSTP